MISNVTLVIIEHSSHAHSLCGTSLATTVRAFQTEVCVDKADITERLVFIRRPPSTK